MTASKPYKAVFDIAIGLDVLSECSDLDVKVTERLVGWSVSVHAWVSVETMAMNSEGKWNDGKRREFEATAWGWSIDQAQDKAFEIVAKMMEDHEDTRG